CRTKHGTLCVIHLTSLVSLALTVRVVNRALYYRKKLTTYYVVWVLTHVKWTLKLKLEKQSRLFQVLLLEWKGLLRLSNRIKVKLKHLLKCLAEKQIQN